MDQVWVMRVSFAYTYIAVALAAACGGRAFSPGESEAAPPIADEPPAADEIEEDQLRDADQPPDADESPENTEPELAIDRVKASLEEFCGECHGAAARASGRVMGNIDYISDLERLVDEGWLVPLGADESPLIQSMRNGTMPPRGTSPRPTPADIQEIVDYVDFTGYWMASDNLGLR